MGETPETSVDSVVTQAGGMNSQPGGEGSRWEPGGGVTLMQAEEYANGLTMRWQEKGRDSWIQEYWGCDNAISRWVRGTEQVQCGLLRPYRQSQQE